MVIPVPIAPVVEWDDEQVRACELLQLSRRTDAVDNRVAEWAVHPLQDRCAQEKLARVRVEVPEDLVPQVVEDVPVIPRESQDELVPIGAVAQRQSGEIDAGRPAFGTLMQRGHVFVR